MRVGREVRISLVLSSWIAVLCCGLGAFGSEMARGTSIGVTRVTRSACRLPVPACRCVLGGTSPLGDGWEVPLHSGGFYSPVFAMAIPDGPGAVWLSILGVVCVSVLKNRRAWISLCLCVLSCGRVSEGRLAKVGVAEPEGINPDWPDNHGLERSLRDGFSRQVRRPVLPLNTSISVILGPCGPGGFSVASCDNAVLKGLPPRACASFANVREGRPDDPAAMVSIGRLSVERKGLARPPPA